MLAPIFRYTCIRNVFLSFRASHCTAILVFFYGLRLFIFHRCIKNVFYHKNQTFVEALTAILSQIHQLQVANAWQQELKFSIICLRELTLYLEGPDLTKKLQFTELHNQDPANVKQLEGLLHLLWNNFICHPCNYLSCELTFWAKRLLQRLYGRELPAWLREKGGEESK